MPFTESNYENCILSLLEDMGFTRLYGPDIARDYRDALYESALLAALPVVNPDLPEEALEDAVRRIKDLGTGSLVQKNAVFMNYLQNGVPVKYFHKGVERSGLVYLIDYKEIKRNTFYAINQWTYVERSEKRPDIVLFINGLPLVVHRAQVPITRGDGCFGSLPSDPQLPAGDTVILRLQRVLRDQRSGGKQGGHDHLQ